MTSTETFPYDVFLSHNAKNKAVVRSFDPLSASTGESARVRCRYFPMAERRRTCRAVAARRRRKDGLQTASQPSTINYQSTGGLDRAQLACPAKAPKRSRKAGTYGRGNWPFRDPLNQGRGLTRIPISAKPW